MKLSRPLKTLTVFAFFLTAFLVLNALGPCYAFATPCPQPTFSLTPLSATNPIGVSHTVTAQVSGSCSTSASSCTSDTDCAGVGTCDLGGTCSNTGNPCSTDAQCLDTCNFACVQGDVIGIGVVSGPNSGATIWTTVDANGQATFSYSSTVEGTDTIKGCLDLDELFGSNDEGGANDAANLGRAYRMES